MVKQISILSAAKLESGRIAADNTTPYKLTTVGIDKTFQHSFEFLTQLTVSLRKASRHWRELRWLILVDDIVLSTLYSVQERETTRRVQCTRCRCSCWYEETQSKESRQQGERAHG